MIKPTPAGASLLVLAAFTIIVGFVLAYPEAVALGLFFVALSVLGAVLVLPPVNLSAMREVAPLRVERGSPALAVVTVQNNGAQAQPKTALIDRVGVSSRELMVPWLHPGGEHASTYNLPTAKRGSLRVGPLLAERIDPMGLWVRRVALGSAVTMVVWPRLHPFVMPPGGRTDDSDTTSGEQALEGSGSFRSLREYVPGDDLRKVHWRSSARTGRLMLRQYVDVERPEAVLLLDDRLDVYVDPEHGDHAVDIAASLLVSAPDGTTSRLATVSGRYASTINGGHAVDGSLDALADLVIDADSSMHLQAVERVIDAAADPRSTCFVITGSLHAEHGLPAAAFEALRRRFSRVVVFSVVDAPAQRTHTASHDVLEGETAAALIGLWAGVSR